jgi:hypothetical protein
MRTHNYPGSPSNPATHSTHDKLETGNPIDPTLIFSHPDAPSNATNNDTVCRICFEKGSVSHKLISPCRCAGSVKFIHEDCLKTWLAGNEEDIDNSKCELCHTEYKMEFIIKKKWTPRRACQDGITQCIFTPILLAVVLLLVVIIYLLASKYLPNCEDAASLGYTIVLLVTCIISSVLISILIVYALRQACFSNTLDEWRILSQAFPEESRPIAAGHNSTLNLDASNDQSHANLIRNPSMSMTEDRVIIIPETIKIKGTRISLALSPENSILASRAAIRSAILRVASVKSEENLRDHSVNSSRARLYAESEPELDERCIEIAGFDIQRMPDFSKNQVYPI